MGNKVKITKGEKTIYLNLSGSEYNPRGLGIFY